MVEKNRIIVTSPSLDINKNIGGISSVTGFLIKANSNYRYLHFELGKHDKEKRSVFYLFRIIKIWFHWVFLMVFEKNILVHFNFALEKRSVIRDAPMIIFAKLLNKRMIIHLHGGVYLEKEVIPKWIRRIIKFILSGDVPIIVLSSIEQELIAIKFQAGNVFVLPNSVDISDAKEFKRAWLPENPLKILFIGRIVKTKGIEYIYQSLKVLKERDIHFKFIMAGSGEDKEEYVRKFSDTLGSYFEFKGVVSGNEKTALLKECNVFLLPSFFEGLPISLLECMSYAQVPVITDVGSIKNVVKNGFNGIIIGNHSSEDISDAIIRLINDKSLLQHLGSNAQKYIFENFSPDKYIKELNRIYDLA